MRSSLSITERLRKRETKRQEKDRGGVEGSNFERRPRFNHPTKTHHYTSLFSGNEPNIFSADTQNPKGDSPGQLSQQVESSKFYKADPYKKFKKSQFLQGRSPHYKSPGKGASVSKSNVFELKPQ